MGATGADTGRAKLRPTRHAKSLRKVRGLGSQSVAAMWPSGVKRRRVAGLRDETTRDEGAPVDDRRAPFFLDCEKGNGLEGREKRTRVAQPVGFCDRYLDR